MEYETKKIDSKAEVMQELGGMRSTSTLPSLLGPLWPRDVALDRFISMEQIELFDI